MKDCAVLQSIFDFLVEILWRLVKKHCNTDSWGTVALPSNKLQMNDVNHCLLLRM